MAETAGFDMFLVCVFWDKCWLGSPFSSIFKSPSEINTFWRLFEAQTWLYLFIAETKRMGEKEEEEKKEEVKLSKNWYKYYNSGVKMILCSRWRITAEGDSFQF